MRTIRNTALVMMIALGLALHLEVVQADPECASSTCECTDTGANWEWASGTLDCGAATAYCEVACESCHGGGVEGPPDCDDQNLTIGCECEPIEGEG